ncbi:PH domain-containing protein [Streptomyces sp. NPDC058773]|uniref:PH domain-containing protein n=1 Tax=Streptomyces sp. NPDC058773 TaxID=3346632 RepID=UPI0036802478
MTQTRQGPPGNTFDRATVAWWRTRLTVFFVVLLAVLVLHAVVPGLLRFGGPWLFGVAAVVALLAVPTVLLLPKWWFAVHRWEVTDTAVHVRTGYFRQRTQVAPLSRVQTVATVRGPLQKRFGLAGVTVTTASAKGPLKIDGLRESVAEDVVRELSRVTGAGSPTG